jgi:folate-dependent phosphoribosylglycinamide formyltransferase PurN
VVSETVTAAAPAELPSLAGRRLLFLGSPYHPLSIACLEALLAAGADLTVAANDPAGQAGLAAALRVWRRRGPTSVAWRIATVALARARLALRAAGVRLEGARSVPELCQAHDLEYVPYVDPNSAGFIELVRGRRIELIVMANYPKILRSRALAAPALGAVNVHPSLLPAFRGPDPLYWIVTQRARRSGLTVHQVDEGIDTGPIVLQGSFSVDTPTDERTLLLRSIELARTLVPRAVALVLDGVNAVPQPPIGSSYFPMAPRGRSSL